MYGIYIYMLTLGYIDGIHVTIYCSTMDPMGVDVPSELKRLGRERFPAREVLLGPQLPGSPVVGQKPSILWHKRGVDIC